jgi:hypothetical protein
MAWIEVELICDFEQGTLVVEPPGITLTDAEEQVAWVCSGLPAGGTFTVCFAAPRPRGPFCVFGIEGDSLVTSGNVGPSQMGNVYPYEARAQAGSVQLVAEATVVNACRQASVAWNPVLPCIPPAGPPQCPNQQ